MQYKQYTGPIKLAVGQRWKFQDGGAGDIICRIDAIESADDVKWHRWRVGPFIIEAEDFLVFITEFKNGTQEKYMKTHGALCDELELNKWTELSSAE